MPRSSRIQLASGLWIALSALAVAFVGGPIVSHFMAAQSPLGATNDINEAFLAMAAAKRAADVSATMFVCGIGLAAGAMLYSLAVLSVWFIGPAEKTTESPEFATASGLPNP